MTKKMIELKEKYGVTERSAELINRMDPTSNKKYVEWLFKVRYTPIGNGKYRMSDDFPATKEYDVRQALTWFERNLNGKIPTEFRDINRFKTITEFLDTITTIATPSRSEIKDSVRVVLDNDRFKIIVPLTFESSKLYGSGTKWCTTTKGAYDNYTSSGVLYYIFDKNLNRKFGLHVPDNAGKTPNVSRLSFFNNEDAGLNFNTIKSIYGEGFNVVIESVESDFKLVIINKMKKKALSEAIKKIESIKREFNASDLKDGEIDVVLNSLTELISKKVIS